MEKFHLSSIDDIYKLQYVYNTYNEITIDTKKLKYTGTLRYAFKYALWALKGGGKLVINDEPFRDHGFSTKRIDFWQIRHEFFKSLKDDIDLIALDDKLSYIKVIKTKDSYTNNGFSFGIVFSGNNSEIEQLTKSIHSILINKSIEEHKYEIIICGPSAFDAKSYIERFENQHIRYLVFDFEPDAKRIMITQKKNYLYENCLYNIVAINHTRILYANDFMLKTFDKKFDVFTPKVMAKQDKKLKKYLDFVLIGSYNLDKKNTSRTLVGTMLNDDILHFMIKRVPYIDGGLTIFNKNIVAIPPYNPLLAWGEAEDISFADSMYSKNILLDYFSNITCQSSIIKFNILKNPLYRLLISGYCFFVKKGLA